MIGILKFILIGLVIGGEKAGEQDTVGQQEIYRNIQQANRFIYTDPSQAIVFANNALSKAEQSGDQSLICRSLVSLGRSYVNLGAFDMGFDALFSAYDKCPSEDRHTFAYVNVNLANLYMSLRDAKTASKYIDIGIRIYSALRDTAGLADAYNAKGLMCIQSEDNEEAERNFKLALALNRKLNDLKGIAKNLNNLCLTQGDTERKIGQLHEAIRLNKLLGATWSLGENYNNLGTQYFYKQDYRNALKCLDRAFEIANTLGAVELICDNYRYRGWVYADLGDYRRAFESLNKLYDLENDMLSQKKIREVERNIANQRFQAQQKEIALQQKEFEIRNLKKNVILVISLLSLFLLLMAYLIFRSRHLRKMQDLELRNRLETQQKQMVELQLLHRENEQKQMQMELQMNKQELINLVCHIKSRNGLLDKIKELIKESSKDAKPEVKAQLKAINAFIVQYRNKENDLDTLTEEIDRIDNKFMEKLAALHPDLTKNEKQLASLLRIDLSTKEIAFLVDSNPKTVNMARYRLRKRLNLETDENLVEYMKNL